MAGKVLFIFDRVTHYNKEMLRGVEKKLRSFGMELHLLSGEVENSGVGRVGIKESAVRNEEKYRYQEWAVGSYTFRNQLGLKKKLAALRPDLIVIGCFPGSIAIWRWLLLKRRFGYKAVSWLCGYEFNPGRVKDMILNQFVPRFDYHLAYHTNAKKYALAYGADESRIKVIHNTVNESRISQVTRTEARQMLHAGFPATRGKKILLYVGAILKEKRLPMVLESLTLLKRPDLMFVVVGDGTFMPEIRKQCADRKDVIFTGQIVEGVGPYFDAADCFILPGTGGLAINEAMAHALPIVSGYADGSADDLVQNGKNGYRLHDVTPEEIARRVADVIDDPEKRDAFGAASRELITGRFSFDRYLNRVCDGIVRASSIG